MSSCCRGAMHRARTLGCAPNADLVRVGVLPEVIRDGPVVIGVLPIDYRAMRSAGRCPHHLLGAISVREPVVRTRRTPLPRSSWGSTA